MRRSLDKDPSDHEEATPARLHSALLQSSPGGRPLLTRCHTSPKHIHWEEEEDEPPEPPPAAAGQGNSAVSSAAAPTRPHLTLRTNGTPAFSSSPTRSAHAPPHPNGGSRPPSSIHNTLSPTASLPLPGGHSRSPAAAFSDSPHIPGAAYNAAAWAASLLTRLSRWPSDPASIQRLADHIRRAAGRIFTAITRGAAAGATLKGGLHLLAFALVLLSHLAPRGRRAAAVATAAAAAAAQPVLRSRHAAAMPEPLPLPPASRPPPVRRTTTVASASADTARYAAFLGSMAGVYVAVDEGLAALFGRQRSNNWRALVAGACAGQTIHLIGSGARHWSMATYVALRGAVLLVRIGNKAPPGSWLRTLLAPSRLEHGDTGLMCLAASQICYSFIMLPGTLPPSYVKFLNRQGAKDPSVWAAIREQAQQHALGLPPGNLVALRNTSHAHHHSRRPCAYYHPGTSCLGHAVGILPHAYFRALGVYFPVYVIPALLVHREKLLNPPSAMRILPRLALGISRSALFLSLFIATAFGSACIGFNAAGATTGVGIAATVWVGGLATLCEKKSRRMELALYCFSRAIESFARCLVEWGVMRPEVWPERMDTALFSAGCAAIMYAYGGDGGRHRDVFRSKYLSILDTVFGAKGMTGGCIEHAPSNRQLLTRARLKMRSYSWTNLQDPDAFKGKSAAPPPTKLPPLAYRPQQEAGNDVSEPVAVPTHANGGHSSNGGGGGGNGASSPPSSLQSPRRSDCSGASSLSPIASDTEGTSRDSSVSVRKSISLQRLVSDAQPGPRPRSEDGELGAFAFPAQAPAASSPAAAARDAFPAAAAAVLEAATAGVAGAMQASGTVVAALGAAMGDGRGIGDPHLAGGAAVPPPALSPQWLQQHAMDAQ